MELRGTQFRARGSWSMAAVMAAWNVVLCPVPPVAGQAKEPDRPSSSEATPAAEAPARAAPERLVVEEVLGDRVIRVEYVFKNGEWQRTSVPPAVAPERPPVTDPVSLRRAMVDALKDRPTHLEWWYAGIVVLAVGWGLLLGKAAARSGWWILGFVFFGAIAPVFYGLLNLRQCFIAFLLYAVGAVIMACAW